MSLIIKTGALTSGALGVLGLYGVLRSNHGGQENPDALLFLLLLGANLTLAGLSYAVSTRARYAVSTLCVSVLCFVTFFTLISLHGL